MFGWIRKQCVVGLHKPGGDKAFAFIYVPRWIPKSAAILVTIEMADELVRPGADFEGYDIEKLEFVPSKLANSKSYMCHSYRFERLAVGTVVRSAA